MRFRCFFLPNLRKFLPRNFSKSMICESLFQRKLLHLSTTKAYFRKILSKLTKLTPGLKKIHSLNPRSKEYVYTTHFLLNLEKEKDFSFFFGILSKPAKNYSAKIPRITYNRESSFQWKFLPLKYIYFIFKVYIFWLISL